MGESVAGKIRIDLLANVAGFRGGLREGKQEMGSFDAAAEKFNRRFDSMTEVAKRSEKAIASWRDSMREMGQAVRAAQPNEAAKVNAFSDWHDADKQGWGQSSHATRRRNSLTDALGMGESQRVTLSREAAETAAAIGNGKTKAMTSLNEAAKDMSGGMAGAMGMGGIFNTISSVIGKHPIAAGATLLAGMAASHVRERNEMARDALRGSLMTGQSVEDVSRLNAVGFGEESGARFERAIGEGSEGFKRLHLDPEKLGAKPMKDALIDVSAAFAHLESPAERARAAVEIFGKNGRMLPVLSNMKTKLGEVSDAAIVTAQEVARVKAQDKASKEAGRAWNNLGEGVYKSLGMQGGAGLGFQRGLAILPNIFNEKKLDELSRKHTKEDNDIVMAEIWARASQKRNAEMAKAAMEAERYAEGMDRAKEALKIFDDQLGDLKNGAGYSAREDFIADAKKSGLLKTGKDWNNVVGGYDRRAADIQQATEAKREKDRGTALYDSTRGPGEIYRSEMAEVEKLYQHKAISELAYDRLRKKNLQDYYRSAHGLDAKQLGERLESPAEHYTRQSRALDAMQKDGLIGAPLASLAHDDARQSARKSLGVSDSAEEFRDSSRKIREAKDTGLITASEAARREKALAGVSDRFGEYADQHGRLKAARESGSITDEEFTRRKRQLRQGATQTEMSNYEEVQPIGAMEAGSAEAYNMWAKQQANSGREQIQQEISKKLDALEVIAANTAPENQAQRATASPAASFGGNGTMTPEEAAYFGMRPMSVVWVRPGGKGFRFGQNGARVYTRKYLIKTDNPGIDRSAIINSGMVPVYGSPHPEDLTATVEEFTLDQNEAAPLLWTGSYTWSTLHPGPSSDKQKTPPDRRPKWEYEFVPIHKYWPRDLDGKAFVDSAGTPFAPPPDMPIWADQITIQRYEPVKSATRKNDRAFLNATNSDAWLDAKPGEALVEQIKRNEIFEQDQYWFFTVYKILVSPFVPVPGSDTKFGGFDPHLIVDAGPKILDASGKAIPIREGGCIDGQPKNLDGKGKLLEAGKPPVMLKFRTVQKVPFRLLNLSPPY